MRSRSALAAVLCAMIAASGAPTARAAGSAAAAPVVAACANPNLPAEILDGPVTGNGSALTVVTAGIAHTTLRLAVAQDLDERERGLMCVTRLRPRHGMVFVFPSTDEWEFWMKNTLLSLDMVWLDADGTVTTVAAGVPASTRTTPERRIARRRGRGSLVIELPGGEAAVDRIVVGAHVDLPDLRAAR